MGKNSEKRSEFRAVGDLFEERKRIDRQIEKAMIPCSHTDEKGKIRLKFIKNNLAYCKECGCEFDFTIVSDDDIEDAIKILHNVINQIKTVSDDPKEDRKILKSLGDIDYNLKQILPLYNKAVRKMSKGGKKHKNNKSSDYFGEYGAENISFIGGGKKKKKNF